MHNYHIAAGAIQQSGENLSRIGRAILAKDTLVGDSADNLYSGIAGDLTKYLVEAGVVGRY
jgi:hypothetical protein